MANGVTVLLGILVLVIGYIIFFTGNDYYVMGISTLSKIQKHKLLFIEEIQEMVESRTHKQAVSKLLPYAEKFSGTSAYWNQVKEQLKQQYHK